MAKLEPNKERHLYLVSHTLHTYSKHMFDSVRLK